MSGIDHLVLCVHDLDAARARYQAMGFTLAPKALHPFGTGNSNIQLQGCFLELLTVIAPSEIPAHGIETFSFAAHNRDFLETGDGFSMLVMESTDARADQQRFAAAGLKTYRPFDFARTARLPDGEDVTVGFSLAFVTDPLAPRNAYFTCQQHAPEHFWRPAYQRHANTAHTITEVCLVSDNPSAHAEFLQTIAGRTEMSEDEDGINITTRRGRIAAVTPARFERNYGTAAPELRDGARLVGYCVGVDELVTVCDQLDSNNISHQRLAGRIVVSPQDAFGVSVAFEQQAR